MAAGKQMNQTAFRDRTILARNGSRRRSRAVTGFSRRSCTSRPCIKDYDLLDPASGSGNFLTETYISIRRLENAVIKELQGGQITFGFESSSPIQVTIDQFYGIEINDFAVTVAKTAL